jgi:hypothetical protein
MQEAEAKKEQKIPDAHKELELIARKSMKSVHEQMEWVLQDPRQCTKLMQLCIARTTILTLFLAMLRLRIATGPPTEEKVETHLEHSMANGLPL